MSYSGDEGENIDLPVIGVKVGAGSEELGSSNMSWKDKIVNKKKQIMGKPKTKDFISNMKKWLGLPAVKKG